MPVPRPTSGELPERTVCPKQFDFGDDRSVDVDLLRPERMAELRAAPLSYAEVRRTSGILPAGYATFRRTLALPPGSRFETAALDLLNWQAHCRAGIQVAASAERAEP
jgi:hypothetical protein